MPIVNVTQLGKSFGAERIFSSITFQIDEHDRIGLVGPMALVSQHYCIFSLVAKSRMKAHIALSLAIHVLAIRLR